MRVELTTTVSGKTAPFFVGCHSMATQGLHLAKELVADTFRFAQKGQPAPAVRLLGLARQA
jgi:hypothetical protein